MKPYNPHFAVELHTGQVVRVVAPMNHHKGAVLVEKIYEKGMGRATYLEVNTLFGYYHKFKTRFQAIQAWALSQIPGVVIPNFNQPEEEVVEKIVEEVIEEPIIPVKNELLKEEELEQLAKDAVEYYQQKVLRKFAADEDDEDLAYVRNMTTGEAAALSATVVAYAVYKERQGEVVRERQGRNYGYTEEFFFEACRVHKRKLIAKYTGQAWRGYDNFVEA